MTKCQVFRAYDLDAVRIEEAGPTPPHDRLPADQKRRAGGRETDIASVRQRAAILTALHLARTGKAPPLADITAPIERRLGHRFDDGDRALFAAASAGRKDALKAVGLVRQHKRREQKVAA